VSRDPRAIKLDRLKQGCRPKVLDLFAGCGGLSLGFAAAQFDITAAIENDPFAAKSHSLNFFGDPTQEAQRLHITPRDITEIEPQEFLGEFGVANSESEIDVIIGGPPCQAFARVGRAKLREVADHPEAFLRDPRGNLYLRFLRYINVLKPLAILVENVPDVLNYGGHNIAEEICEVLDSTGYDCRYTLLNSVFYGVPQMRERMFLIATWKELHANISFPKPTHKMELPPGYANSRKVALKGLHNDMPILDNICNGYYVKPPVASRRAKPAVTAEEALADLPRITTHLEGTLRRGARRFTDRVDYLPGEPHSHYAKLMRSWRGFQANGGIYDHVIRFLPRDYPIFERMHPGDQYPEAFQHALRMFDEKLRSLARKKKTVNPGTPEYERLKKAIVPPYDPGKFPNKWRKMEPDKPARTLLAHLGKDGYSHIHYDSAQARTISVREAARLQSFPDGFVFAGTMNPAFRQIGNAVPPLLAKAIAKTIRKNLKDACK